MFRIVIECKEFNCDKVLENLLEMVKQMQKSGMLDKLPGGMKIPPFLSGSMFTRLPDQQKIQMLSMGLSQEKARLIPVLENMLVEKLGQTKIRDFELQYVGTSDCVTKLRLDVDRVEYDKAIDMLLQDMIEEQHIPEILGDNYEDGIHMDNLGFFMHGQNENTKEYLVLKSMSVERTKIMQMIENLASSKELLIKIATMRFMLKN